MYAGHTCDEADVFLYWVRIFKSTINQKQVGMKLIIVMFVVGLFAFPAKTLAYEAYVYERSSVGLSVAMPDGWVYHYPSSYKQSLVEEDHRDFDYDEKGKDFGESRLLVFFLKNFDLDVDELPVVVVALRGSEERDPVKFIDQRIDTEWGVEDGFEVLEPPHFVRIDGIRAGYMSAYFDSKIGGEVVRSEMNYWVIPRKKGMMIISFVTPEALSDKKNKGKAILLHSEVKQFVSTFKVLPNK